jgi:uncharacterized protein (DUF849 family)
VDKLIINFTPTGMVPTKAVTPHVPVSVAEIVDDVLGCAELGASIIHLHARDKDEEPTPDPTVFAKIIAGIRAERTDLILCVTTSGRTHPDVEDRAAVLDMSGDCKPDMASLTLGSMNFLRSASLNAPQTIQELARRMTERGIKPELEVFDTGMINYAQYLMRKGQLAEPGYFNLLLGNIATAQATEATVDLMLDSLPPRAVWALAGIGDCQQQVHQWAIDRGGHVRVGLEDSIYFDATRQNLATNRALVERVVEMGRAREREPATASETRTLLGLDQSPQ